MSQRAKSVLTRRRSRWTWRRAGWIVAVIAAPLVVIAAAYALRFRPQAAPLIAPAPLSATLRLDGPFDPRFAGEMVAERSGLFEREGLRLDLKQGAFEADPVRRVSAGDDTIGVAGAERFLMARGAGAPIVAFAGAYLESPVLLYALEESGIRTPYDFAGKRIGYRRGGDTALIYDAMMAKLQLPRGETRELSVGSDPTPLMSGEIDVWPGHVGGDGFALKQAGVNANVISPASYGIHVPGTVYFTNEKIVRDEPSLVRRFLRAVIAGWQHAYENEAESVRVIVSFGTDGSTPDRVRFTLAQQRGFLRPLGARFGEFDDVHWRSLQDILVQEKLMKERVDISRAITYEFLRDAYRNTGALAQ
jgi:NitT/TauT family transport system substrate-binding protein